MEMNGTNAMLAAGTLFLLAGCGGGGSGLSGGGNPNPTGTAGGIWRGTESVSKLSVIGIVDESGQFQFVRSDGVQYVGTATVNGTSLTANLEGIVPLGFTFGDGSHHGTGSLTGTLDPRKTITSTTKFTTDFNNSDSGTLNLTFDPLYDRASSLTTVSGNFVNAAGSAVVTVGTNGAIFSQDANTGCVLNGSISIINATYNAYKVQFDYASCVGTTAALNGVQFTGLAMLDNTVPPEQIVAAATGQSGNTKYSVVLRFNRT
jgi:hypothetical protein